MRLLTSLMLVGLVVLAGCNQPTETVPTVTPGTDSATSGMTDDELELESSSEAPPNTDGARLNEPTEGSNGAVRFVADTRLEVPGMMCPYGCYPTIEEALVKVEGVEGVQLAEQPPGTAEGEIKTRVVELKVGNDFDLENALAALEAVKFKAKAIN